MFDKCLSSSAASSDAAAMTALAAARIAVVAKKKSPDLYDRGFSLPDTGSSLAGVY